MGEERRAKDKDRCRKSGEDRQTDTATSPLSYGLSGGKKERTGELKMVRVIFWGLS